MRWLLHQLLKVTNVCDFVPGHTTSPHSAFQVLSQQKQWKETLVFGHSVEPSGEFSYQCPDMPGKVPSRRCAVQHQKTFSAQQTAPFCSIDPCPPSTSGIPVWRTCCLFSTIPHHLQKYNPSEQRQHLVPHFQCITDVWPLQQCLGWQETSTLLTCQFCVVLSKVKQAPGLLLPVLQHWQGATYSWKGGKYFHHAGESLTSVRTQVPSWTVHM